MKKVKWIFDEGRPSGARSGGDPAKHAFEHGTDVFVREVLQNAIDQARSVGVEVNFKFFELFNRDSKNFFKNLSFSTLRPHLKAVANTKTETGRSMKEYFKRLHDGDKLTLLRIEDKNTSGLKGPESGDESNFTALCKDELYSHKKDISAAGSYGLGKSVLWSFSNMSTVLFNSNVEGEESRSPRFIGRTNLASHKIQKTGKWYDFSGWLGQEEQVDGAVRAVSLWEYDAREIADALYLSRDNTTGTSIMIVGFRDPTSDAEKSVGEFQKEFEQAVARYFWPAIIGNKKLGVGIEIPESPLSRINPENDPEIAPFVKCYREAGNGDGQFDKPGDVVTRRIPITIPAKHEGQKSKKGEVLLSLRFADEDEGDELQNRIAIFRGAEMVVDYWRWKGYRRPLGARPFHACLSCGRANGESKNTDADEAIEEFLRCSEPPSHRKWTTTENLKQTFKQGYGKTLKELKNNVDAVIKELVVPEVTAGERGPDMLRKRFPIVKRSKGGSAAPSERPIRFRNPQAYVSSDSWKIEGTARLDENVPYHEGWSAVIQLRSLGENKKRLDIIPIEKMTTDSSEAKVRIENGKAYVDVTAGADEINFEGESVSLSMKVDNEDVSAIGAVELEIDGKIITEVEYA